MSAECFEYLRGKWQEVSPMSDATDKVLQAYMEDHRKYHGLPHLVAMFKDLEVHDLSEYPEVFKEILYMAIFYHDVVYKPTSKDSERLSAQKHQEDFRMSRRSSLSLSMTNKFICDTWDHQISAFSPELEAPMVEQLMALERLFLDLDLAILGKDQQTYEAYADQILEEYTVCSGVPQCIYLYGRICFLTEFVQRPRIFRGGSDELEGQARHNAACELKHLRQKFYETPLIYRMLPYVYFHGNTLWAWAFFPLFLGVCLFINYFTVVPRFPWPVNDRNFPSEANICFAGSFDPPHPGHVAIIEYLSTQYREVHVYIANNPRKMYKVDSYNRRLMCELMAQEAKLDNVTFEVLTTTFVWQSAVHRNCQLLARGIRSWKQDGLHELGLMIQNQVASYWAGTPVHTLFIHANPLFEGLSSSRVKRELGGHLKWYSPTMQAKLVAWYSAPTES